MSRVIVKFRTNLNVYWGRQLGPYKGFTYLRGFPALFIMTQRRAIVVGEFLEKQGWFKKKRYHRICFEAGLNYVKDFKMDVNIPKKRHYGHISFYPHNQLGEGTVIQFLNMNYQIADAITRHLNNLEIKKPVDDTGIILIDGMCPPLDKWVKSRLED